MRLLLAITVFLAAAVPALAADSTVDVGDDFYDPSTSSADPGNTVTWNWSGSNDHTVTSRSKQIDRFKSGIQAGPGKSFRHTFKYPGRFRYFCEIHPDSMQAAVRVGSDDGVAPKITSVRAGARKVRFKLSERSVVTVKIKGRKRIVKTFGPGKHAVRFKRLAAGRHKASLSAKDGFGHTGRKSKRFRTG
jgi:plastocyanin